MTDLILPATPGPGITLETATPGPGITLETATAAGTVAAVTDDAVAALITNPDTATRRALDDLAAGGGGLKVYNSWAEVDAETESVMGVLVTDDGAPAGLTHITREGAFFITTQVQTTPAGVQRRQELRAWDGIASWRKLRQFPSGGPWGEWRDAGFWDIPTALRSSLAHAEDAIVELYGQAFNNPETNYVVGHYAANWRNLTGFAELPDGFVVAHVFRGGTPAWAPPPGHQVQTVVVPLPDGTSRTITRVSTNGTSYGAWTLQPTIPDSPPASPNPRG